eukprot:TRINITY_DN14457_c0_g1_i1.p1 TRINITY_DN14457_c0_g1~~TRINITY_DN14457_c0_g1_i1.p1  ORF type:complete len:330 (-),score=62.57 TRINITY_DN14457_c0_g1_i1:55-1023(-)
MSSKITKGRAPDPFHVLRGHLDSVNDVLFPGVSQTLLSCSLDGSIRIWDVECGSCRHVWDENKSFGGILCMAKRNDREVVLKRRGGKVEMFNLEIGSGSFALDTGSLDFCRIICWDDCIATTGKESNGLFAWDVRSGELVNEFHQKPDDHDHGMVMCLQRMTFGSQDFILCGREDGSVDLLDMRTSTCIHSQKIFKEAVLSVETLMNGKIVAGSADCEIITLSLNQNPDASFGFRPIRKEILPMKGTNCIKERSDGKIFAVGGWDRRVRIFQSRNGHPLAILKYHTGSVNCVDFHSSGRGLLASGAADSRIALWNIYMQMHK